MDLCVFCGALLISEKDERAEVTGTSDNTPTKVIACPDTCSYRLINSENYLGNNSLGYLSQDDEMFISKEAESLSFSSSNCSVNEIYAVIDKIKKCEDEIAELRMKKKDTAVDEEFKNNSSKQNDDWASFDENGCEETPLPMLDPSVNIGHIFNSDFRTSPYIPFIMQAEPVAFGLPVRLFAPCDKGLLSKTPNTTYFTVGGIPPTLSHDVPHGLFNIAMVNVLSIIRSLNRSLHSIFRSNFIFRSAFNVEFSPHEPDAILDTNCTFSFETKGSWGFIRERSSEEKTQDSVFSLLAPVSSESINSKYGSSVFGNVNRWTFGLFGDQFDENEYPVSSWSLLLTGMILPWDELLKLDHIWKSQSVQDFNTAILKLFKIYTLMEQKVQKTIQAGIDFLAENEVQLNDSDSELLEFLQDFQKLQLNVFKIVLPSKANNEIAYIQSIHKDNEHRVQIALTLDRGNTTSNRIIPDGKMMWSNMFNMFLTNLACFDTAVGTLSSGIRQKYI